MVLYLDRIIERWQSKRKTLEISQKQANKSEESPAAKQSSSKMSVPQPRANHNEEDDTNNSSATDESINIEEPIRGTCSRLKTIPESDDEIMSVVPSVESSDQKPETSLQIVVARQAPLAIYPTMLYAAIVLVAAISIMQPPSTSQPQLILCAEAGPLKQPANQLPDLEPGASLGGLGMTLIKHLAAGGARDRWTIVPTAPENVREQQRPGQSRLAQAINRLSNRIGARNTIRVHNAFRDFAWRILSRLSMPTPVIYELRRQNLYSPEDDQFNDSLHAKNTSRTIRSKRLLDLWKQDPRQGGQAAKGAGGGGGAAMAAAAAAAPAKAAAPPTIQERASATGRSDDGDDDDDDEPETLRERARMRLFQVVRPSRRSIFGRAIRWPSILAFKRQEQPEEKISSSRSRRRSSLLKRRRRQRENDRQMISIDGKQYYVDDEGKLRELKEEDAATDKRA